MAQHIAVLSGDLVGSTDHTPRAVDAALARIRLIESMFKAGGKDLPVNFTRSRGDGWQFALLDVGQTLRLAVQIVASLKGDATVPQSRVAIGIGSVVSLGQASLAEASGAAFTASGRALDSMARERMLTVAGAGIGPLHIGFLDLLDLHLAGWSRDQAEAAALSLKPRGLTGRKIATTLGITAQAVSARLRGANAPRVNEALKHWEAMFTAKKAKHG